MVRDSFLQFGGSFRICLFQFSYLGTLFRIQFFRIERFQNRFCCVVLREKVVAETTLSACLQGRTIRTKSAKIILPGNVVQTFGIIFTASNDIERSRCARLNSVNSRSVRLYRSGENNLFVIRHLVRYLLTVNIKHYNLRCVCQLQFGNNVAHRHFNHLSHPFKSQRIGHCDCH